MKKPFVKYNHATIQSTMSKDKSKFLAINPLFPLSERLFSVFSAQHEKANS
jgi:hypothetical protein